MENYSRFHYICFFLPALLRLTQNMKTLDGRSYDSWLTQNMKTWSRNSCPPVSSYFVLTNQCNLFVQENKKYKVFFKGVIKFLYL